MKRIIIFLKNKTPVPIKSILKFFKLHKLISPLYNKYIHKYTAELEFQTQWAKEFKSNKNKVFEFWEEYRFLKEINKIIDIRESTRILDVGCGISTVLHFLKGQRCGIDPLAEEYKKLYTYPNDITILKGKGENIPFPDEYFDVVFCSNVLDHVSDPQKTIDNIFRVLKKNGFFILTVTIIERKIERDAAHPHSLTKPDIENLLGSKFKKVFEGESPWIGERRYARGERSNLDNELILLLQKYTIP